MDQNSVENGSELGSPRKRFVMKGLPHAVPRPSGESAQMRLVVPGYEPPALLFIVKAHIGNASILALKMTE